MYSKRQELNVLSHAILGYAKIFESEQSIFGDGVKAAGPRARKALLQMEKLRKQ